MQLGQGRGLHPLGPRTLPSEEGLACANHLGWWGGVEGAAQVCCGVMGGSIGESTVQRVCSPRGLLDPSFSSTLAGCLPYLMTCQEL